MKVGVLSIAHGELRADALQHRYGIVHKLILLPEDGIDGAEISAGVVTGDAAREDRGGSGLCCRAEIRERQGERFQVDVIQITESECAGPASECCD